MLSWHAGEVLALAPALVGESRQRRREEGRERRARISSSFGSKDSRHWESEYRTLRYFYENSHTIWCCEWLSGLASIGQGL